MKNCHNCRYMTGEKRYKCSTQGWVHESDLASECYNWKQKQKEAVEVKEQEKLLTRKEMVIALMENPKRKGLMVIDAFGVDVESENEHVIIDDGYLVWGKTHYKFQVSFLTTDKSKWQIIEPEPQEVEFAEAFLYYYGKTLSKVESIETGRMFDSTEGLLTATQKEVKGKWRLL